MKYLKKYESEDKFENEFKDWNNLSEEERKVKAKKTVPRLGVNALNVISKMETGKEYTFKELNAKSQTINSLIINNCIIHNRKTIYKNIEDFITSASSKNGYYEISHDFLWNIQYYEDLEKGLNPKPQKYIRKNDKFKIGDYVVGNIKIRKDMSGDFLNYVLFINNNVGQIVELYGEKQYKVKFLKIIKNDFEKKFNVINSDHNILLNESEIKTPTKEQLENYFIQKNANKYNL